MLKGLTLQLTIGADAWNRCELLRISMTFVKVCRIKKIEIRLANKKLLLKSGYHIDSHQKNICVFIFTETTKLENFDFLFSVLRVK